MGMDEFVNKRRLVRLPALLNDQMDQRELAVLINGVIAGFNGILDLRVLSDPNTETTKRISHGCEVWVLQLGTGDPAGVVTFLVRTDRAVFLVVHHDDQRGGTVLRGSGKLLTIHEELTVPGHRDDTLVRMVQ